MIEQTRFNKYRDWTVVKRLIGQLGYVYILSSIFFIFHNFVLILLVFCFNKIIHLHICLSFVTDFGLRVYNKTQTTNKQEAFNVKVKSHPHIHFLPTHPHSISAAHIRILPVATSAYPRIRFLPIAYKVTYIVSSFAKWKLGWVCTIQYIYAQKQTTASLV